MEQLDKFINNINNPSVILFVSGLLLPIVLYLLPETSSENLFKRFSLWGLRKTEKIAIVVVLIVLMQIVLLAAFSSDLFKTNEKESGLHVTHTGFSDGDVTKRYTVSFLHPENIQPNQKVRIGFKVNDANTGNQVQLFKLLHERVAHLVIVDSELKLYKHLHPAQEKNEFFITTQFPHPGVYHLYIDFLPWGADEQRFAFTVSVGNSENKILSDAPSDDLPATKKFGDYLVTLTAPSLNAEEMTKGQQQLIFTITDAKTGEPVTTLRPYLQAFGHLVMIHQETFEYLHVHPTTTKLPLADDMSGPEVSFVPLALYSPVRPGIYRAFAQFNPDGKLFTADFTVEVK